jgi:hypothetical protein
MNCALYEFFRDQGSIIAGLLALCAGAALYVISIVKPGRKAVAVVGNPIFLTSPLRTQSGAEVTFEVLEINAGRLKF